ncbi:T9SS type A sorting domain-containing protein [Aureivirga marina]|uniref:T9SS type A sorting domain-containing protein n=1 Tax=Aureivirga marina TaxID=1182451 RepID=UPI0018CA83D3|nr:T9SS type A sorting domain-containing protein [Aureivirga marina]
MKKITLTILLLANIACFGQQLEFEEVSLPVEGTNILQHLGYSSASFGDIDNDGDQDLIMTGVKPDLSLVTKLYKNDGTGTFTEMENPAVQKNNIEVISFVDIDNDNDLDLFMSGTSDLKFYRNNGSGIYSLDSNSQFNGVIANQGSLDFADIDNDGDQDLFICGANNEATESIAILYENDGTGNFTKIQNTPFTPVSVSSVDFSDVDNDGDQDLMITGFDDLYNRISNLYLNDGTGNFSENENNDFLKIAFGEVVFVDIDNDNDEDLIQTGSAYGMDISTIYINDGLGNFTELENKPFIGMYNSTTTYADIDNDGNKDLLFMGHFGNLTPITKLYRNISQGLDTDEFSVSNKFEVYPNPANNTIAIKSSEEITNLSIFDITGKTIYNQKENIPNTIDISKFSSGTYFVKLDYLNSSEIKQLIIE